LNKKRYSLGIFIDIAEKIDKDQNVKQFINKISENKCNKVIVTPNLNHLRVLHTNDNLRENYLSADHFLADGMPIVLMARLFSNEKNLTVQRLTGVDLVESLLLSTKNIFVIGSNQYVITKLKERIKDDRFLGLQLECNHKFFDSKKLASFVEELYKELNSTSAQYVLLALGYPKQEELALMLREYQFDNPKFFFCIGGSLDILSGVFPRAPIFIQNLGFEWIWRLFNDFRRLMPRYFQDFVFLIKYSPLICIYIFGRRKH